VRGRRLLVTGAAGFIGSHVAERLVVEGARVTCLVHYNAFSSIGNLEHLDARVRSELQIEHGNIEDGDYVLRLAEGQDAILHLAALIGIPFSYVSPRSYLRTNIEGTLNILEAARHGAVGRVLHTSTSEVYGTALRFPIDEEHALQGQSPYSASCRSSPSDRSILMGRASRPGPSSLPSSFRRYGTTSSRSATSIPNGT
jgi:nucleoside-diphosphate-sugar epimerase